MATASSIAASASSRRPRSASRMRQVVQRPGQAAGGVRLSAERVRPVLGDLLAGEGGGQRGEPHAVLGHLVGELGGQAGLGRQLQREAGQVGQFGGAGGDRQVDDPGQCRGEQLVQSRPDGGLVRGAAGQLGQQLGQEPRLPSAARRRAGRRRWRGRAAARCRPGAARRAGPAAAGSSSRARRTAGAPTPPALRPRSG